MKKENKFQREYPFYLVYYINKEFYEKKER